MRCALCNILLTVRIITPNGAICSTCYQRAVIAVAIERIPDLARDLTPTRHPRTRVITGPSFNARPQRT